MMTQADFPFTLQKAQQLDELAQHLMRIRTDAQMTLEVNRNNWRGEAANAYFESGIRLDSQMKIAISNMERLSSVIRNKIGAMEASSSNKCPENSVIVAINEPAGSRNAPV